MLHTGAQVDAPWMQGALKTYVKKIKTKLLINIDVVASKYMWSLLASY